MSDRSDARFKAKHMSKWRIYEIEQFYGDRLNRLLRQWYLEDMRSGDEIAEMITAEVKDAPITSKAVCRWLRRCGITLRTKSESFKNAMKRGRMVHEHQRKVHKLKRKWLAPHIRYEILERDKFRCVLCGANGKDTVLEVDHDVPVYRGGSNEASNLRTLCWECNSGKRIVKNER